MRNVFLLQLIPLDIELSCNISESPLTPVSKFLEKECNFHFKKSVFHMRGFSLRLSLKLEKKGSAGLQTFKVCGFGQNNCLVSSFYHSLPFLNYVRSLFHLFE